MGIHAVRAPKGVQVLMVRGCKPPKQGKKCQPFRAGHMYARDGSLLAEYYRLGSRQPDPQGVYQNPNYALLSSMARTEMALRTVHRFGSCDA